MRLALHQVCQRPCRSQVTCRSLDKLGSTVFEICHDCFDHIGMERLQLEVFIMHTEAKKKDSSKHPKHDKDLQSAPYYLPHPHLPVWTYNIGFRVHRKVNDKPVVWYPIIPALTTPWQQSTLRGHLSWGGGYDRRGCWRQQSYPSCPMCWREKR